MGEIGCYDLNLYCDGEGCKDKMPSARLGQFVGRNYRGALREAHEAGWTTPRHKGEAENGLGRGRSLCPDCSRRKDGPSKMP